ncbi:MAG: PAS domain-containing sensor histidine kinase [Pseudomonadota bacterium]|nr:PAS domain-containing sensor histidine kinase [Pseudomonadota bacterium]
MTVKTAKSTFRWLAQFLFWTKTTGFSRKIAIALTCTAFGLVIATYLVLAGWGPFRTDMEGILYLLKIDLVVLIILGTIVIRRLVKLWIGRHRGYVGSRLNTRLVLIFSLVAVTPAIIISASSAFLFYFGLQWIFSDTVKKTVAQSHAVAEQYLKEHQETIRGEILAMARDLNWAAPLLTKNPIRFQRIVASQGTLRSLSEVVIFNSRGTAFVKWSALGLSLFDEPVPVWALDRARQGAPVLFKPDAEDRIRALVKLEGFVDTFLFVARFIDHRVLERINVTRKAVHEYREIEGKTAVGEIAFALMFGLVALLLLLASIWLGLYFATGMTRPIAALVNAAENVRKGDLNTRVEEGEEKDEVGTLTRVFNRMTAQLSIQRDGLVEVNRQLDERRYFIETVLSGVSSGVVGLDQTGKVNVLNSSAAELSDTTAVKAIGKNFSELVPETSDLLKQALDNQNQQVNGEIIVKGGLQQKTIQVRISPQKGKETDQGFVVTFDDISELVSAQRKAAWSDVARKIAHEIKNPLTPIQLAAERLQKLYQKKFSTNDEIFMGCTETIVRQVRDIGKLVDEFSSFARMPAPIMKEQDIGILCKQSTILFSNAHQKIKFLCKLEKNPTLIICDFQQVSQALTNLLQNAVDSITTKWGQEKENKKSGSVDITIEIKHGEEMILSVIDNGLGLPFEGRDRLIEPYVTTREKGTGLGLAIVTKIMEDHNGKFTLADRKGGGAKASLIFPFGRKIEDQKTENS